MVTIKQPDVLNIESGPTHRMTEEEFVAWVDEDTPAEWVDGEVIMASPASAKHVDLVGFLNTVMRIFVSQRNLGAVYGPELQIRLAAQRRRRVPDLLFISQARLDIIKPNHIEGAPDLAVEIASPDSIARDWRDKYLEYEAAGVREYWVIDPMAERVEAYTLTAEKKYALIEEKDGVITSTVLAGFYLKPAWLWQETLPNPLEILKELNVVE